MGGIHPRADDLYVQESVEPSLIEIVTQALITHAFIILVRMLRLRENAVLTESKYNSDGR